MNRYPLLYGLLLALALPACASIELPPGHPIGDRIESQEVLRFSVVDASPSAYFDRVLLVQAEATQVCQVGHCWMQIKDGESTAMVRWDTGCGGEYSFPDEAVGKTVIVQGTFYPVDLTEYEREHLVEESGGTLVLREDPYEFNATGILIVADD